MVMYLHFHQLFGAYREWHTHNVKPLDTVVYWLDDAEANDAFCRKVVLFSIGQYSNSILSAFIWHAHEEHFGTMLEPDCEYRPGVLVPCLSLVASSRLANSSRLARQDETHFTGTTDS